MSVHRTQIKMFVMKCDRIRSSTNATEIAKFLVSYLCCFPKQTKGYVFWFFFPLGRTRNLLQGLNSSYWPVQRKWPYMLRWFFCSPLFLNIKSFRIYLLIFFPWVDQTSLLAIIKLCNTVLFLVLFWQDKYLALFWRIIHKDLHSNTTLVADK